MDRIKTHIELLKRRISRIRKRSLQNMDKMIVSGNQGNPKIYRSKDGNKEYIRKGDWEKIVRPAIQAEYERRLVAHDMELVDYLEKVEEIGNDKVVLEMYDETKRQFITPVPLVSDEYVRQWLSQRSRWVNTTPGRIYRTDRGDMVRSKSETLIANRLHKDGIPYRYEFPVDLGTSIRFPDFTILNRRTGEEFIYEHLGMMDDARYRSDNFARLEEYAKAGFVLGRNLLLGFESEEHPFNMNLLEAYIKTYFT